ncbi:MAG TPA: S8 family peptidase [Vicinamibacterales bacterium]|nr:S8 family peptidase [Vicinamibacterales bacterium]
MYVQFDSPPGVELKIESLEDKRKGIEVVAVRTTQLQPGQAPVQRATVFVPDGQVKHFITRFEQYSHEQTKKGEPRHKEAIDRIAALRRATLRALWTDSEDVFPPEQTEIWWEVWLRRHDGRELERFHEFAGAAGFEVGARRLAFPDRIVVLAKATASQLAGSIDVLNDLAELRLAKTGAARFDDAAPTEQAGWVDDLRRRTTPCGADAPAVCVLDTGVNRGHPLLETVIAPADATAVDPAWGSHDDGGGPGSMGHGTEMAGLAAYGDLAVALQHNTAIDLRHCVESVKILPPTGANPPELYGAITSQAVSRPEITAPTRRRTFSLAVTATDERDRGEPTSWSAAIDALAAGRSFNPATHGLEYLEAAPDVRRLFVISTGNVSHLDVAHLDRSDVEPVHDPAHAWNALTVGAYTEKATLGDNWDGWSPIAPAGDLSPWSTTSVSFREVWPVKPDVVFEGGNVAHDGAGGFECGAGDLCLLSTYYKPAERMFVLTYATSASTAQVARLTALILAEYPDFWPETVRGLVVHSARWTKAMEAHLRGVSGKRGRAKLVRRYGFGVPSVARALRSANDALTLVAQSTIRPFSKGKMREMHVHQLPWPAEVLEQLGPTPVRLRVTLSYFVEPNPGRRGWKKRHRYASHGLRFDVKTPTETLDDFRKRLNEKALEDDDEKPASGGDSSEWYLGEQTRNRGSIHSDIWVGTAADLAARGVIGVYPVSGWWKEQPKRDRSALGARYSLIVSIETDAEETDIWTPVAQQIGVPVVEAPVEV